MKHLTLILLLLLLLLSACDRFEHKFDPPEVTDYAQVIFTPIATSIAASTAQDVSAVMNYYTAEYMHNGINREDRQSWYQSILSLEANPIVQASVVNVQQQADTLAVANWRLVISSPATRNVLVDSTFIGERVVLRGGTWQLKGNQASCSVPNPKQRIFLEYFSFLGCPNCPVVEAKIHALHEQYAGQLSYLVHHINGPLTVTGDDTFAYYGYSSVPATVFQGETKLVGSGTEILEAYDPLVQNLSEIDAPILYNNLLYTLNGQTLQGSIKLEPQSQGFDQANLKLNVVLMERESSYTNTAGENLVHIVRAKTALDISAYNLNNPITFTLNSNVALPDDLILAVFAQRKPATFANNATILGGIETSINNRK